MSLPIRTLGAVCFDGGKIRVCPSTLKVPNGIAHILHLSDRD